MSNINMSFQDNNKVMIVYTTAGYPIADPEFFVDFVLALEDAGVNIVEVGVPFSDPVADGGVIQRAMQGALQKGVKLQEVFYYIEALRRHSKIPVVIFGYFNPFFRMGLESLKMKLKSLSIDAILIVDLPIEEGKDWFIGFRQSGIDPILIVSNNISPERLQKVSCLAGGFIYVTSMYSTTGNSFSIQQKLIETVNAARSILKMHVCVGFGIKNVSDVLALKPYVDGVIVGSAIIESLEAGFSLGGCKKAIELAASKARELANALREDEKL